MPASDTVQPKLRDFVGMKILVVEDDRKVAGFIDHGLKEEGYVVDVRVGNLRRKLARAAGEALLKTVRGVGFSLVHGSSGSSPDDAAPKP